MRNWLTIPLFAFLLVFGSAKTVPSQMLPSPQDPGEKAQEVAARAGKRFTRASQFRDGARSCYGARTLASLLLPRGETYQAALIYTDPQPVITAIGPASADRGAALFSGGTRLQRGGPPCIACHSVAGLRFPGGGTLGPNLTHTYTKLGPEGIDAALQTLFFPAMTPLYEAHQLTPQERSDLKAFFEREDAQQPQESRVTVALVLLALGGFVVLVVLVGVIWRDRLKSVRRCLVESASR